MLSINYKKTPNGDYIPAMYPGEKQESAATEIPEGVRTDWHKLNSMIETKYSREYLKICAFYNKVFPSLKSSSWTRSAYNTQPFTTLDQERVDTGTGINTNFLKQIIDQVVSRLGTISFDARLQADVPTLEFLIYKDEIERLLRKIIRNEGLNNMAVEVFHNASVLGYSHILMCPVTHKLIKVNDYELGIYESQWTHNEIKHALYRDYAFPITSLPPYLAVADSKLQKEIQESIKSRVTVDFKLFIDCVNHQFYVTVDNKTLPAQPYPFDIVQLVTFKWDTGFTATTSTSLFDLLYPSQREINKILAKIQQLVRAYKGSVPVFNSDVDLAMKQITNGSGECLYVDSTRPVDTLVTVINPTPLDTALDALVTSRKTEMYELAGIQGVQFDEENLRSAASIIAVSQSSDTVFNAQMKANAQFQKDVFRMIVRCKAKWDGDAWEEILPVVEDASIDLTPVHVSDPMGNQGNVEGAQPPDYAQMQVALYVKRILKDEVAYATIPYVVDKRALVIKVAETMVQMDAMQIELPDSMQQFMIDAFIEDVQLGVQPLAA